MPTVKSEDGDIHRVLKGHGVKYSHRNDQILVANPIEEERSKAAVKVIVSVPLPDLRSSHFLPKGKTREGTQIQGRQDGCDVVRALAATSRQTAKNPVIIDFIDEFEQN